MKKRISPRWIGVAVAASGLAMMAYGVWRGEVSTVFTKAIHICLECIGIG